MQEVETSEKEIKPPSIKIAKASEIEQKAKELKELRALPEKPGNVVNFYELQQWLKLLTKETENRITIWVYRLEPTINRQLVDPDANNNIDVLYTGFNNLTEDTIKENHGGGSYKFVIRDEDKPKGNKGGFFEANLSIPMLDCPPKLDLREVEWDNPRNKGYKSWCRAKRLINDNNMPVIEKVGEATPQTNGVNEGMLKMLLDFTAKMSEKEQVALKRQIGGEDALSKNIGELMLEKMKQEDPNKQMTAMVSMIAAIKGMTPEPKPDSTLATIIPMFMQMMDRQASAADKQFQMMMAMFQQRNEQQPVKEDDNSLDKLRAIIELSKEIKGGGAINHEKTMGEQIMEIGKEILPPVLNIVGNIVAMNAAAKGMGSVPAPQATPQRTNGGVSAYEAMNRENQASITSKPAQQQTQPMLQANDATQLIQSFEPIILNHLVGEGWEFGAWVSQGYGDMVAASIASKGPQALLAAAKSVPSFWEKIEATYGEAHLLKWLESLCNYKEEMAKADEGEAL